MMVSAAITVTGLTPPHPSWRTGTVNYVTFLITNVDDWLIITDWRLARNHLLRAVKEGDVAWGSRTKSKLITVSIQYINSH